MLPDDDMLKAFICDTVVKETEGAPSPQTGRIQEPDRKIDRASLPRVGQTGKDFKPVGRKVVLPSVLKWGLLVLAAVVAWILVSK